MPKNEHTKVNLTYIGGPGAGFGFKLAGIETKTCHEGSELLEMIKTIMNRGEHEILFVDEGIAESVQEELASLTSSALCSVVLLPNPTKPKRLAAKQMDRLMIQAVGSDIFKNEGVNK